MNETPKRTRSEHPLLAALNRDSSGARRRRPRTQLLAQTDPKRWDRIQEFVAAAIFDRALGPRS
ncbi:MAG: hypothetical protein AMXMBFR36_38330 [Acidobacteriota bacterium]